MYKSYNTLEYIKQVRRRTRYNAAFILLIFPLLCGCTNSDHSNISPESDVQKFSSRQFTDAGLQEFITKVLGPNVSSQENAWDITRLTLATLYFHPDILVAKAELETARAGIKTAGQLPNPSFTVLGGPSAHYVGYGASILIEFFGRRYHRIKEARYRAAVAQWEVINTAWKLRSDTRSALLGVWAVSGRLKLVEETAAAKRELFTLEQARFDQGRASAFEISQVRTEMIHAELSVSDLRREYAVRKAALAGAIGVPAEALDSIALDTKAFDVCPDLMEYRDSQDMRYQAVMQRADLRELLASYDAARQALRVEVSRRYPDVTISPAYNWDFSNRFEVNPSLQIPIFNQNEGPIAEAVGQEHEAAARLRRAENTVFKSISQATANYRGTTSILLQAEELAKTVRVRLNQMQHRLQSGAIDRPTMVMTHIEQLQAETALLEAEIQQRQAIGQIEDGMQQPIFDHTNAAQASGLLENNQRNSP